MNTIWLPPPVLAFFRQLVNVVSTLSIISRQSQLQAVSFSQNAEDSEKLQLWKLLRVLRLQNWWEGPVWRLALSEEVPKDTRSNYPKNSNFDYSPRSSQNRPDDTIHRLMHNPVLYDPLRKPRYPIALCHGMFDFFAATSICPFQ